MTQYEDLMINDDCSIAEAMKKIENNSTGMVFLCGNGEVTGSLSSGDIRRGMLKKISLSSPAFEVARRTPVLLRIREVSRADTVMKEMGITAIPLTDEKGKVIAVKISGVENVIYRDRTSLFIPLVIMAGGRGLRLKPYTDILPKPLIPIGNQTITERILRKFRDYDCSPVYMIVNYRKEFIKAYFREEGKAEIRFIDEEKFLGTGGGLHLLKGMIRDTFFLSNCDILVEADYSNIYRCHKEQGNLVTVVCARKKVEIPYGTVEISEDGRIEKLKEKPVYHFNTSTGLYMIEPEFIEQIPENTFIHITDVIQICMEQGKRIGAYLIEEENWMDMGQLEEMERMKEQLGVR